MHAMDAPTALASSNAIANLAVRDIARARAFYGGVLGLAEDAGGDDNLVTYRSGDSRLIVYRSDYAGTNQATAATWVVGDRVDDIVRALGDKGVRFEHYDNMPDTTRQGDVHVGCGMRVAWFKDPDGNILNVVSG
ncbi:MAG: glyoxalase [Xanthomonadaceae bacterium]|nr:glyoxalase [Xanthomonadaceae bacterium]